MQKLLRLSGRLDLLTSQISLRRKNAAVAAGDNDDLDGDDVLVYHEGKKKHWRVGWVDGE